MTVEELKIKQNKYFTSSEMLDKAAGTVTIYKASVNKFLKWLEEHEIPEISKSDTVKYKEYLLKQGYSAATINNRIIAVNKFLKWSGNGDITVKTLKQQHKTNLDGVITFEEYKRLIKALDSPPPQAKKAGLKPDRQLSVLVQTLAGCGCRFSELRYFTVENITKAAKIGSVTVMNKGKIRSIPVCKDLIRLLKSYCREKNISEGYIFVTRNNTPISNEQIHRRLKRIAGYARIPKSKVYPHNFRHLFAKSYMENLNRIDELKDILGHSSIAATSIYTRTSSKEKAENINSLGLILR